MKRENYGRKIRRKILTETRQLTLFRRAVSTENLFCAVCGEQSEMAVPLVAARFFNLSTREIFRQLEAGRLHFLEFEDRRIYICLRSLENARRDYE